MSAAQPGQAARQPARQLALPLPFAASHDPADLLEDRSNQAALAWLRRPQDWPGGRLALFGPAATGKTHMLRGLAAARGWPVLEGPRLRGLAALRGMPEVPPGPGLAVDDADCAAEEEALLHLLNLCAEGGQAVLLAGREAPARWPVALPDLRSRLRAMTAVAVLPPSDSLLAALLQKHFTDRQLRVDPGVQAWLLPRLPREAAAVAEAAARLDRAALATGGRLTRSLARAALADLPGFGATDDDSTPEQDGGSTSTPRLL
ncbi:chromosomal replication initiator DnaA [Siccirubricoccus sp. G192]|uniref:chromosomal replication initiator DnaA n=1 Tax=Siccirubricoccus sp. G192 TaxID=2849651 RepID=UPI001C2C064C|nr:chromosomal replication initiator DnaA [Siccirubricoccus sp. G192]MBV1800298.1 chromosomal replication initiator DnaA [Siccirubricoccus sp. G192]